ncbi:N-acetylmuramic acid 6-phosphate etherase, partial [Bacillus inaquosorum]|nr:N-acetylmuramic acid 6-phosphate etherase [Bacillus inaquosorum]
SYDTARNTLEQANHHVKTAIVMLKTRTDQEQAKTLLNEANGFIDKAIENYHS